MFSVAVNMNIYIFSRFDRGVSDRPHCRYVSICLIFIFFKSNFILDMFSCIARKYPRILLLDFLFVFERGLKGQNTGEFDH